MKLKIATLVKEKVIDLSGKKVSDGDIKRARFSISSPYLMESSPVRSLIMVLLSIYGYAIITSVTSALKI